MNVDNEANSYEAQSVDREVSFSGDEEFFKLGSHHISIEAILIVHNTS